MRQIGCFIQPFILLIVFNLVTQHYSKAQDVSQTTYIKIIELEDDTNKVLQLLGLSKKYRSNDTDTALNLASLAQNLSDQIGYDKGKAEALYQKSVIFKNSGQLDSAIYFTNYSSKIFKQIGFKTGIANNSNLYGSILRRQGLLSAALESHKESLNKFTQFKDSIGLAKTYNYIGIVYNDLAIYDSAVVYYLKLIRISEKIDFINGYVSGLLNTGQVYFELGEYDKAKYYLKKSIKANESINSKKNIALAFNKLGLVEFFQEREDSAYYYFDQALFKYEEINLTSGLGWVNLNIANILAQNEDFANALSKYSLSKVYFEQIGLMTGILKANINIAVIYEKQGEYRNAIAQYDTCLRIAHEIGGKDELLFIYNNIYKTYRQIGNETKALNYLDKYISLKDSIFNLEKTAIISDLELKYEKEKNEAEILALNLENVQKDLKIKKESNRKNMFMAAGGLFFLVALFLFLYFRQLIKKNKQLAKQKLLKAAEKQKLSSAQALLEGQEEERIRISKELHDGVGVLLSTANLYLSTVAGEAIKNKELVAKAQQIVNDANIDVRKISRNLMPTVLALNGLNEALQDLMENIDLLPDKYGEFHVTGNSKPLSKPREVMVYRMVQELISNTMKHANAESVDLELDYQEKNLQITYLDDGIGFDFEKELLKKSLGLKSIRSRVDSLKGTIDFSNGIENGVQYVIRIPITEED